MAALAENESLLDQRGLWCRLKEDIRNPEGPPLLQGGTSGGFLDSPHLRQTSLNGRPRPVKKCKDFNIPAAQAKVSKLENPEPCTLTWGAGLWPACLPTVTNLPLPHRRQ
jgi:hypothetical protein